MGAQIDGCGLAEVLGTGTERAERKKKEEGVQATVRQGLPAVTGLSLLWRGGVCTAWG